MKMMRFFVVLTPLDLVWYQHFGLLLGVATYALSEMRMSG